MTKKALYLSYDGLTDPLGQSQILPYLKGLCRAGYQFHIISFEKPKQFKRNKEEIENSIEDFDITWHPQVYHKNPPVFSTIIDLRRMLKNASQLVKAHDIRMVHARSYPPGLIGLILKKRFGIKFLFDIRGFWADERVEGGIWKLANPIFRIIYHFFKRKEIDMMHGADHIVSLTHAGKAQIVSGNLFKKQATGIESEKITVIPCAVDLDLFNPKKIIEQDRQELLVKLGLANAEQILIYLGSLGTWYMLDEMLLYFKHHQELYPKSRFLVISKDDSKVVLDTCDRFGISKDLMVITSATRAEVPLHISIATFGIFFIRPTYSKKASSATKMGEMMAMGLPFITNKGVGDTDHIIEKYNCGELVDINKLKNSEFKEIETNAIRDLNEFSLNNGVSLYANVYHNILKSN